MKVVVVVPHGAQELDGGGWGGREEHVGDEVTADTENGELLIRIRNAEGREVHWCRYAEMQWLKVYLEEGMSTEVMAARATRQVYTAATGVSPAPVVAGNSGPGY